MILSLPELLEITGLAHSVALEQAHQGVEAEIKSYCGWDPESATYTNIMVDGAGGQKIWPGHKNITSLVRAATGKRAAINIKHSTASSNAYAKVTYTGLVPTSLGLVVADGTDESSTTDAFADYATLTLLVAQINTRSGNGWSAELSDSTYGIFAPTTLLEVDSLYAGTEDGNDPGWSELQMPGQAIRGVEVERTEGGLYLVSGWPSGTKNIALTYTAGWTSADMPADLKNAVVSFVQYFYNKQQNDLTGIKSYSMGRLRIEYATEMASSGVSSIPVSVLDILDLKYRIMVIV